MQKQESPRLRLDRRFSQACNRLPVSARAAVLECLTKLLENPAHPSLNYEGIRTAADPRMRSIRVNEQYRAIVAHPDGSGEFLLLWVDKHDEAYAWAARHRFETGRALGGLEIVELPMRQEQSEEPELVPTQTSQPEDGMLRFYTPEQMHALGISEALVPALQRCQTENDLQEALAGQPETVVDLVLDLWFGEPRAVSVQQLEATPVETLAPVEEPDALATALRRPGSVRNFLVVTTQEALVQALTYPLERWRVFLHPEQKAIVRGHFDGPALVSGGAGTGKTVVGLHRARYLATEVFTAPYDRILLTTFTINLAENLSQLMDSLCADEPTVRQRIEVTHVHSLVAAVRKQAREPFGILSEEQAHQLMRDAVGRHDTLSFPVSFYLAEWQEVVQEREALTEEVYLLVDREGRGRGLTRRQRVAIWKVLEAYRQSLVAAKREGWSDVVRSARLILENKRIVLPQHYRAVIVDEAQDMGTPEMRFLLALVGQQPNALLLLGDTRQQIYARGSYVRLLHIPIGRRHMQLRVNYRTTEQIRSAASSVVTDAIALTGESLGRDESISLLRGPTPSIQLCETQAKEEDALIGVLRSTLSTGMLPEEIVVIARSGQILNRFASLLLAEGLPNSRIDGKSPRGVGIQLATMHRAKGLEFRAVFIVGCSANVLPQPYTGDEDDPAARADHEERERRLLYVAMTRARELLWISSPGTITPFLA